MGRVEGKVALISGGARNIGGASARMLVAEGASVVIGDLLDDEGKTLADELCQEFGAGAARYVHLDVTQDEDWRSAVELTVAELGRLDVLFNNAGIFNGGQLQRYKREQWQQMLDVNLTGAFLGIRAAADALIAAGGGSIINTSSIEGLAAAPTLVAYTASKFAIRGMTKVAALELGDKGIRVNSVHPGMIETQMLPTALGGISVDLSRLGRRLPLRRVGHPDEVANLLVFLASDESSYCTGSEFVADGGATAGHALSVT